MPTNTSTSMSANLHLYYLKTLLDRLTRSLVLDPLGQKAVNIPKGLGKQAKWLRYAERHVTTPSTLQLTEGVIPTDVAITAVNVTATVLQYGTYAIISDLLNFTAIDPVIENTMEVLSDEAKELIDTIIVTELDATLPNQFANGKANLAATGASDVMTAKEFLKAVITLKKNNVPQHSSGAYVGVVHPAGIGDIMNDTNVGSFVDINKYTSATPLMNGEIGKVYGTRVLESTNLTSTTTGTLGSATVYSNLFLGKGCFGTVQLGDTNLKTYIKGEGEGGTSDPLNQISTVGYKLLGYVAKYLGGSGNSTSDRGLRIRAGSSF